MTVAKKVWELGKPEPDGLFDTTVCPNVPPNWFAEDPTYAAVLYAMEVRMEERRPAGVIIVCVLDDAGNRSDFRVHAAPGMHGQVLGVTSYLGSVRDRHHP